MGRSTRITLEAFEGECVRIRFPYNRECLRIVRTVEGRCWSARQRCWTVPWDADQIDRLKQKFSAYPVRVVESAGLRRWAPGPRGIGPGSGAEAAPEPPVSQVWVSGLRVMPVHHSSTRMPPSGSDSSYQRSGVGRAG